MAGPANKSQHDQLLAAISLLKIRDNIEFEYHVLRSIELWREFERGMCLQTLVEWCLKEHGFSIPRIIINKADFAYDLCCKMNNQLFLEPWGTERATKSIEENLTSWNNKLPGHYRAPAKPESPQLDLTADRAPDMSVDHVQDSPQPGPSGLQAPSSPKPGPSGLAPPGQLTACAPISPQPGPSRL